MKSNHWTYLVSAALASVMLFGLCACTQNHTTVYEVATQLGYEGDETGWIAGLTGSATEARKMYDEAVSDGYAGTYVDFLKEIGYSGQTDHTASVANALMSVVSIRCAFTVETTSGGGFGRPFTKTESTVYSAGSGVIYYLDKQAGDAYIVTNYHVVYEPTSKGNEATAHISDNIEVYLYGALYGSETSAIAATYIGGTMEYDIAVLRVQNSALLKESYSVPLKAVDSDAILAGERVYAVGNAEGKGISVTEGVVSVDAEYITMTQPDKSSAVSRLVIRTDAPVNHGNSGGGLFNADGKLIGVVNARSEETDVVAFGYAIPSNLALAVVQNIIDNSAVNDSKGALRAMLGVTVQITDSKSVFHEDTQRAYITETVAIKDVNFGSAAYGKLKAGDVIYSLRINDGTEKVVTRMHMLGNTLFNVRKGDTVKITLSRDGKTETVSLVFDQDSYFTVYD